MRPPPWSSMAAEASVRDHSDTFCVSLGAVVTAVVKVAEPRAAVDTSRSCACGPLRPLSLVNAS